jgi:hypothetical protein
MDDQVAYRFPHALSRFHKLILKNVSPSLKDCARGDKHGKKTCLDFILKPKK